MPFYDYKCPAGHTTERRFSMADKPDEVDCVVCGMAARSVPSRTQATMGCIPTPPDRPQIREVGHTPEERWLRCSAGCEGEVYDVAESSAPLGVCASCSAPMFKRPFASRFNKGESYPYYDKVLKMVIRSASHKRDVLRERGLIEIGEEVDYIERTFATTRARHEAEDAAFDAYVQRLRDDPELADYRRAIDTGKVKRPFFFQE